MCCCKIKTLSVLPQKSSDNFGNLWQSSENVQKTFGNICLAFRTILENLRQSSEKSSKMSSLLCWYNKQNITCSLVDTNFVFSCTTWYLTSEHSERGRYWVEHSKTKFISTCSHEISSIYLRHFYDQMASCLWSLCRTWVRIDFFIQSQLKHL